MPAGSCRATPFAWQKYFSFGPPFFAVVPPFVGGAADGYGVAVRQHLANITRFPHYFLLTGNVYHLWFLSSLLQGICLVWLCLRFWKLRGAVLVGGAFYAAVLLGGGVCRDANWFFD